MLVPLMRVSAVCLFVVVSIAALNPVFAATRSASVGPSGAGTISGFVISDVAYQLSEDDPSSLEAVLFTATAAASDMVAMPASIFVWFDSSTRYACRRIAGAAASHYVRCDMSDRRPQVISMRTLHVSIAQ